MSGIIISGSVSNVYSAQTDTISVGSGKTETKTFELKTGAVFKGSLSVSGFEDNKINFWVADPNGVFIIPNTLVDLGHPFEFTAKNDGTYTLFFKNTGSIVNTKTVTLTRDITNPQSGCLIATASFGSELAPQVQFLRELRDNAVLNTYSGTSFMAAFNQFYYSFSPTVADWERQSPVFKEFVKITITPMLSTLSILNYVDIDSEQEMLGYGIGIILLNIGIYFVVPALVIIKLRTKFNEKIWV